MRSLIQEIVDFVVQGDWTPYERYLRQVWQVRTPLTDDELYKEFYCGSDIDPQIVSHVRAELAQIVGEDLNRLRPSDNFIWGCEGLDFADVIYRMECLFHIRIPSTACPSLIDGTFDSLVRFIAMEKNKPAPCED